MQRISTGVLGKPILHYPLDRDLSTAGLSLTGGGQGFPLATMNVAARYFQRKNIEEK